MRAAESGQSGLGVAPEVLDAVDVVPADAPAGYVVRGMIRRKVVLTPSVLLSK